MSIREPDDLLFGPAPGCVGCGAKTGGECLRCGSALCATCHGFSEGGVCGRCAQEISEEVLDPRD